MKKIILASTLCVLSVTVSFTTHAEIFKWTDSKGVTHYSARAPIHKKKSATKVKNIEDKIRFAAGKHRPPISKTNSSPTEKQSNSKQDNTQLAPPDKKLINYCKQQRSSLAKLKANFRNIWRDADGKEKILTQEERKEKVNYLVKRITEDCEGV